jgi:hypothetical protein
LSFIFKEKLLQKDSFSLKFSKNYTIIIIGVAKAIPRMAIVLKLPSFPIKPTYKEI